MLKTYILLLFLIGIVTSCAVTPIIEIGGMPAPNFTGFLRSPGTGIEAHFSFIRFFPRTEGKEVVTWPEYLPLGENLILKRDTKEAHIMVRIHNPRKEEFSLWEEKEVTYIDNEFPYFVTHCFYKGGLSANFFKVALPIKNVVSARVKIIARDKRGNQIFYIGEAKYKMGE